MKVLGGVGNTSPEGVSREPHELLQPSLKSDRYPPFLKIDFCLADGIGSVVKDAGSEHGISFSLDDGVVEMAEVTGAAAGDDGHAHRLRDGLGEMEVIAGL